VQIAITQPIRIEDAVIIEDEWGWVEDIASTYVVIPVVGLGAAWVVPLAYFIERPFQNWTAGRCLPDWLDYPSRRLRRRCSQNPQAAGAGRKGIQAVGRRHRQSASRRYQCADHGIAGAGQCA